MSYDPSKKQSFVVGNQPRSAQESPQEQRADALEIDRAESCVQNNSDGDSVECIF